MIVLYQFDSCPFCQRVQSALEQLDISYRVEDIDPWDRARVIELSGQSQVPMIVDESRDGEVVFDSATILSYLQEHHTDAT